MIGMKRSERGKEGEKRNDKEGKERIKKIVSQMVKLTL